MEKYETVFHLITSELEKAKAHYVLIGDLAVGAYGYSRFTRDCDILMTETEFLKAKPVLEAAGYQIATHQKLVAIFYYKEKNPNFLPVDIVFVDDETFKGILEAGKTVDVFGVRFTVPSLEHLIAMKLHAIKNNPKRALQDLTDLVEIIKKNPLDVYSEKFRELCLKYASEEWYRKIIEGVKK